MVCLLSEKDIIRLVFLVEISIIGCAWRLYESLFVDVANAMLRLSSKCTYAWSALEIEQFINFGPTLRSARTFPSSNSNSIRQYQSI